ncbi:hypothetical protein V7024_21305 [Bacillus sp. JJ864]|uniref:hypothetical protein n=1 Tax=Bacillus TaxID=1386 RepID=UPI001F56F9E4
MGRILKGILFVPIQISNVFQSFLGTLLGMIVAFVFTGTVLPLLFKMSYSFLLGTQIWYIVNFVFNMYNIYIILGTLITILPWFSYKGKIYRNLQRNGI